LELALAGANWADASDDTRDYKWDSLASQTQTIETHPAYQDSPSSAPDPSVDSLLARMAQAISGSSPSHDESSGIARPSNAIVPTVDSAALESLLARMAQAVAIGSAPEAVSVKTTTVAIDQSDSTAKTEIPEVNPSEELAEADPAPSLTIEPTLLQSAIHSRQESAVLEETSVPPVEPPDTETVPERSVVALKSDVSIPLAPEPPIAVPTPAQVQQLVEPEPVRPQMSSKPEPQKEVVALPAVSASKLPSLHREQRPEPMPHPIQNAAPIEKLRLNAIAALGKRRAASINGRSLFQGEEANFDVDGVNLRFRCVEIRESSVIVQMAGINGTTELKIVRK
jgi:hypothetical protein